SRRRPSRPRRAPDPGAAPGVLRRARRSRADRRRPSRSGRRRVTGEAVPAAPGGATAVLRNRLFLVLWSAQVVTQIGANMVLFGLTVLALEATDLSSTVSLLFLTFLMPSVLFSALAGVY